MSKQSSSLNNHIEVAKSLAPVIAGTKKALEGSLGLLVDTQRAASTELQGKELSKYEEFIATLHKKLGL